MISVETDKRTKQIKIALITVESIGDRHYTDHIMFHKTDIQIFMEEFNLHRSYASNYHSHASNHLETIHGFNIYGILHKLVVSKKVLDEVSNNKELKSLFFRVGDYLATKRFEVDGEILINTKTYWLKINSDKYSELYIKVHVENLTDDSIQLAITRIEYVKTSNIVKLENNEESKVRYLELKKIFNVDMVKLASKRRIGLRVNKGTKSNLVNA